MANERARALRKNQTAAERKLWAELKKLREQGFHFRKQAPISEVIVDFACLSRRLIIEVDGATHSDQHELETDAARDAVLRKMGFSVIRVSNADVFGDTGQLMDRIVETLQSRPSRFPSP